jgi:hypothetical protein
MRRLRKRTASAFHATVDRGYSAYRACYQPLLKQAMVRPSKTKAATFKAKYAHPGDTRIRFVGVWDTVDAVGLPFHLGDVLNATVYRFKFPDQELSSIVDRACHALAIDDERWTFHPLMWTERPEDAGRISQVWFAGAHSNVGGGYPKQGMSFVALDWMLEQAAQAGRPFNQHGLRLNASDREWFREHASVDDKLYDPRTGLGVFYRWRIRDIEQICKAHGVRPKIHVSVLERIAHGTDDYSPGNLPADADVVFTPPPTSANAALAERRAAAVQKVLATVPPGTLLASVQGTMAVGQLSYYIYIATGLVFLKALWGITQRSLAQPEAAAGALMSLLSPWETTIRAAAGVWAQPSLPVGLLIGFLVAYVLTLVVEARMSRLFSGFWFQKQEALREGLKQARRGLTGTPGRVPSPAPPGAPAGEALMTAQSASLF